MARLQVRKSAFGNEKYFHHLATKQDFRRITAGLAWPVPGERDGALVVLGEQRCIPNVIGPARRSVFLLDEQRSADIGEMLELMAMLTEDWLVPVWATPSADTRTYAIDDANRERRKIRRPRLRYADPQAWSGVGEKMTPFYLALIQRRTVSEKTLHLGPKCTAKDELITIQPAELKHNIVEFPAFAALAFALAEIDCDPMPEPEGRQDFAGGPADALGGY